jgi:hypothetical protein
VFTGRGLGRRREDRRGQPVGEAQPGWQGNAAHLAGRLVVLPAGADQVAARHRLDRQRPQAPRHAAAQPVDGRVHAGREHALQRAVEQVVGHQRACPPEPEQRSLGEYFTLARDRVGQHDIERRQAVGRDDQQGVLVDGVNVTHLAPVKQFQAWQL